MEEANKPSNPIDMGKEDVERRMIHTHQSL